MESERDKITLEEEEIAAEALEEEEIAIAKEEDAAWMEVLRVVGAVEIAECWMSELLSHVGEVVIKVFEVRATCCYTG